MKALLDTHTFLWWISNDPQLSLRARQVIADSATDLFLSVASGWEIAIKSHLGKLRLPPDLQGFVAEQVRVNEIQVLPIEMMHVLHVHTLPDYHRDPFDRLLVAQSQLEKMPILTGDAQIGRYAVAVIW